jgi:hypothetical protein
MTFTDAELEDAITRIRERHPGDRLEFAGRHRCVHAIGRFPLAFSGCRTGYR